jgi:hypothetical protein
MAACRSTMERKTPRRRRLRVRAEKKFSTAFNALVSYVNSGEWTMPTLKVGSSRRDLFHYAWSKRRWFLRWLSLVHRQSLVQLILTDFVKQRRSRLS